MDERERMAEFERQAIGWGWKMLGVLVLSWIIVALVAGLVVAGILASGAAHAQVPEACRAYERDITRQAHNTFGIADPPISVLAAQMQQESSCNPRAQSPFASGLTQFTPGTVKDMAKRYPTELGAADPFNPRWAIAAQALYMRDLTKATPGATWCDTWAFGLSGYNGGPGWLTRDRALCLLANGCDRNRWFGHVELTPDRKRAPHNIAENRGYPKRILLLLVPRYIAAAYPGGTQFCAVRSGSSTTAPTP